IGVSRAAGPRRTHAGPRRSSEQGNGPTVTGAPEPLSDRARPWWTNERARSALGAGFDVRDFHHQVLGHGPLPLDTLDEVVARWVAAVR
ncbi:MAG: DUF885 family protein, partial [Micromonosporaceae bacterium]|nr:DUF885 family protein [Micromonosporaceae bacterium]